VAKIYQSPLSEPELMGYGAPNLLGLGNGNNRLGGHSLRLASKLRHKDYQPRFLG